MLELSPETLGSHHSVTFLLPLPQALLDLQGVMVPAHLQTNRTAQAALAGRYRLRLSATPAELLMRFLHAQRLTLMLALLNEFIELAVRVTRVLSSYAR